MTPTLIGSRSASPIIGAWTSLQRVGLNGIVKLYEEIVGTCDYLYRELASIEDIKVIGKPRGCAISFKWADS